MCVWSHLDGSVRVVDSVSSVLAGDLCKLFSGRPITLAVVPGCIGKHLDNGERQREREGL